MKTKTFWSFAIKNLKANRFLEIPFILSTGTMCALFYITVALLQNHFIQTRNEILPSFMQIGAVVIGILALVFVVYANNFLVKQRYKEFSLYSIMGLEKKHIARILFLEGLLRSLLVAIIGILGGHLLGKLLFALLNFVIKNDAFTLMDYPFNLQATLITLAFIVMLFTFLYLKNTYKVHINNPMGLMQAQNAGEKEPKANSIILILGLIFLGVGYFIALTTTGLIESIGLFWIAVICVVIGTYFLFMSLSIFILKAMKNNQAYYYQANHFLSVSGMLYRMKANAVGIASICILCTGIMIVLSTTLAAYQGMDNMIKTTMPYEYKIADTRTFDASDVAEINQAKTDLKNMMISSAEESQTEITDFEINESLFAPVNQQDNVLSMIGENAIANAYIDVSTIEDYNASHTEQKTLADNEIYMSVNENALKNVQRLKLGGVFYKVKPLDESVEGNIAVASYKILVQDHAQLERLAAYYQIPNNETQTLENATIGVETNYDVKDNNAVYEASITQVIGQSGESGYYQLDTQTSVADAVYNLNGGFLFLGLLIGLVFLIGTTLIIYYKQVSEGYEDRHYYQIMKKVGLTSACIQKTANMQILWLFILPLIVALIHTLVASKILFHLLRMFGIYEIMPYFLSVLSVTVIFLVVYLGIYHLTSKIYYKIVN